MTLPLSQQVRSSCCTQRIWTCDGYSMSLSCSDNNQWVIMSEFMRVTGVTLLQMSFEVVPALTVGHPNVSISTYVVDNVVEPGQGHSPSLEAIRLELHHCAVGLLLGEDRLQVYVARVYMEPPLSATVSTSTVCMRRRLRWLASLSMIDQRLDVPANDPLENTSGAWRCYSIGSPTSLCLVGWGLGSG
jgi:hypothetical protein